MAKKTLGKYEIIDRLGRGGMAEVYRAYHAALDRYVAIKLLHPFLADDSEFKERFEREAQNIAKLRHPHIVQVFDFDFDEVGESYYMVMELVEGKTLKDILFELASNGQKVSLERAIQVTRESALALSYAHKRNMIHRDVKPANLMVEESDGRVVLTDFGIAKIVTGAQFTASGGMIGTPAYMSPEQGMGESGDERSDLYSLGVILYQMITGQLPYDADTPLAIILKHLNEPLPSPRTIDPDIPEWLETITRKTLAKDPNERFANADELIMALDSGAGGNLVFETTHPKYQTGPLAITRDSTIPLKNLLNTGGTAPVAMETSRNTNWLLLGTSSVIILGVILMITIVFGQGGRGPLASVLATDTSEVAQIATDAASPTVTLTETASPTATFTDTPSPTATFTDTPSPTATFTDTPSPTVTFTETPSPTASLTPSLTPSPTIDFTATAAELALATATRQTATVQAQADFFATQRAITPTQDVQRVLETCDLEYVILSPEDVSDPPSTNANRNPRLVQSGQAFELELILQNTSTCDWPKNLLFFSFVDNAEADISQFDAGCEANRTFVDDNLTEPELANIRINREIKQGEQLVITLEGQAGDRFGCYFGVWELRIPDYGLFIGDPILIAYRAFGGN